MDEVDENSEIPTLWGEFSFSLPELADESKFEVIVQGQPSCRPWELGVNHLAPEPTHG